MRPDAHKKKASAQYKKKHGLSGDKKVDKGGGPSADRKADPGGGGRRAKEGQEKGAEPTLTATGSAQNNLGMGHMSSATGHSAVDGVKPSFRRRQLTSNWDRYDCLDQDHGEEEETLRGADFGLLLNVASTSLSQFRFADEQDWDDEPCDPQSFLSVDCIDLAEALLCEPLHKRLGLSYETFSVEEINRFTTAAERHVLNYKRKPREAVPRLEEDDQEERDIDLESSSSEQSDCNIDQEQPTVVTTHINSCETEVSGRSASVKDINCLKTDEESLPKLDKSVSTVSKTPAISSTAATAPTPAVHLANPSVGGQNNSTYSNGASCSIDNSESDLDLLLSLDEPAKSEPAADTADVELENTTQSTSSKPLQHELDPKAKATPMKTTTTNLEDWLDDFLDD